MADDFPHDTSHDEQITKLIESGEHGSWENDGKHRVFTPRMSFFADVPPHKLASYFVKHGGDDLRLNLP